MKLESKYNIGDTVYCAQADQIQVSSTCPDCLGGGRWAVMTPAGESVTLDCPTCMSGYYSTGIVLNWKVVPVVNQRTIGWVTYDTSYGGDEPQTEFRYMCKETGIGTGSVYSEKTLCAAFDDAYQIALGLVKVREAHLEEENARTRARNIKEAGRRLRAKPCLVCDGTGKQPKSQVRTKVRTDQGQPGSEGIVS